MFDEPPKKTRWWPTATTVCDPAPVILSIRPAGDGFTWKFDPFLWSEFEAQSGEDLLLRPRCPTALMWGERSALVHDGLVQDMAARLPAGSRLIPIPEAYHHVMADQPLALVSALRGLLA